MLLIGVFLIVLFIFILDSRSLINILSVVGTMASFFGLAIAFIQIIALKQISEITQTTIGETKNKLILGISISDVTEAIKLISEIDNFFGNQKYEIARLKLIDLKDSLVQFKTSEEFKEIIDADSLNNLILDLNAQISALHVVVYSDEEIAYNPESIITQIQDVSTYLSDFRNKIKYQTV